MQQAIYIDWHNLFKACEKNSIPLETVMGEITKKGLASGEIQEIRLFVPVYLSATPWRVINALQCKFGVEVSTCPVLTEKTEAGIEMKDAVDFEVLKWVVKYLHQGVSPDTVIFVTGDGHFLISSNEAKRKGKKTEFWFVDSSSVHRLIKRQEEFREIKTSPPVSLVKENPFLETLRKITDQEELDEKEKERLKILVRMTKTKLQTPKEQQSAVNEISLLISAELGLSRSDSQQLLEALMTLGIARIYPAVNIVVDVDRSSPLFQWLRSKK